MAPRKHKLKKLRLERVDFVDRGANPGAMITLFKRDERLPGALYVPAEKAAPVTVAKLRERVADLEAGIERTREVVERNKANLDAIDKPQTMAKDGTPMNVQTLADMVPLVAAKARALDPTHRERINKGVAAAYGSDRVPTVAMEVAISKKDLDIYKSDVDALIQVLGGDLTTAWNAIRDAAKDDPTEEQLRKRTLRDLAEDAIAKIARETRTSAETFEQSYARTLIEDEQAKLLYRIARDPRASGDPDYATVKKFERDCRDGEITVNELTRRQRVLKAVNELTRGAA